MVRQDVEQYEATPALRLPVKALRLIAELLDVMAQGQPVAILKQSQDVTTQEAAQILNVSRPYLIKLLSDHKIPFHTLGKHRRMRLDDVLRFQSAQRAQSLSALLVERSALADAPDAVWHDADDVFDDLDSGNAR
jgi:excisionase family DNA binding protein